MNKRSPMRRKQRGMMLIEALIAILIFSLGVLGMVAMGTVAVAAQSDAQYRTEAANYANEMAATMALASRRGGYNAVTKRFDRDGVIDSFTHLPTDGGYCSPAGAVSTNPLVEDWLKRISGAPGFDPKVALPGATTNSQQINVSIDPAGFNQVTITICWKPPSAGAIEPQHRYTLVTYIN